MTKHIFCLFALMLMVATVGCGGDEADSAPATDTAPAADTEGGDEAPPAE